MLNDNTKHLYKNNTNYKARWRPPAGGAAAGPDLEGRFPSAREAHSLTHGISVSLESPNDHESLLVLTPVWGQVASVALISEPSSYSHLKEGWIWLSSLCLHCPVASAEGREESVLWDSPVSGREAGTYQLEARASPWKVAKPGSRRGLAWTLAPVCAV